MHVCFGVEELQKSVLYLEKAYTPRQWILLSFLEGYSPRPITAPLRVQGSPVWNFFHVLTSRVYRVLFHLYDCASFFVLHCGREASHEGLFWEGTAGRWIALLLPESAFISMFWELREISNIMTISSVAKIKLKRELVLALGDGLLQTQVGVWRVGGGEGLGKWVAEQARLPSRRALRSQSEVGAGVW